MLMCLTILLISMVIVNLNGYPFVSGSSFLIQFNNVLCFSCFYTDYEILCQPICRYWIQHLILFLCVFCWNNKLVRGGINA